MQIDVSQAKKPVKLSGTLESGKSAFVFACGECGYTAMNEQMALECCAPHKCDCGASLGDGRWKGGWTSCQECRDKQDLERLETKFESAKTKVKYADYDGDHLYDPQTDKFYDDADSYVEDLDESLSNTPILLFGCMEQKFCAPDAHDIIESELERQEFFEDAHEWITDEQEKELQTLLDGWAAKINIPAYQADYSTVVDLSDEFRKHLDTQKFMAENKGQPASS